MHTIFVGVTGQIRAVSSMGVLVPVSLPPAQGAPSSWAAVSPSNRANLGPTAVRSTPYRMAPARYTK